MCTFGKKRTSKCAKTKRTYIISDEQTIHFHSNFGFSIECVCNPSNPHCQNDTRMDCNIATRKNNADSFSDIFYFRI